MANPTQGGVGVVLAIMREISLEMRNLSAELKTNYGAMHLFLSKIFSC